MHAGHIPAFLKKNHAKELLKRLNLAQRKEVLSDAYAINQDCSLAGKMVLIVDDISTTGSSLAAIAAYTRERYPTAYINGFCLAKTMSMEFDHVPGNTEENESE
jgi:predicted amidophosphoribosyltransferase